MTSSITLFDLIYASPVAEHLASCLTTGGLLNLARTNSHYRAILHGFALRNLGSSHEDQRNIRSEVSIGKQHTNRWENLKRLSQWVCESPNHTKGSAPRYCRLCSIPICEACIVRDSIGKSEKTYLKRTRHMCKDCWLNGRPHRGCRIDSTGKAKWKNPYVFAPNEGDFCTCTPKDNWLCLDCKAKQNAEANQSKPAICFGEACNNPPGEEKDRRRICLWCDHPLTRGPPTMESRIAYDMKCLDQSIRLRNQYRNESWQEKLDRLVLKGQLGRISRRDLIDVKKLPTGPDDGNTWSRRPHFLAAFDVIDYAACGVEPPQQCRVLASRNGEFRYDENFLLQFRDRCFAYRLRPLIDSKEIEGLQKNCEACPKIDPGNFQREEWPSKSHLPSPARRHRLSSRKYDNPNAVSENRPTYSVEQRFSGESQANNNSQYRRTLSSDNLLETKMILGSGDSSELSLLPKGDSLNDDYDLVEDLYDFLFRAGSRESSRRSSRTGSFVSARSFSEDAALSPATGDTVDRQDANDATT